MDHSKLCKILKDMAIPDHLPCLLRDLYRDQEAIVRTRHGTNDWFQIGKVEQQGSIFSPCLFNLYSEYTLYEMPGWMNQKLGSRLSVEISIVQRPQICRQYHSNDRKLKGTKEPLDESESEE